MQKFKRMMVIFRSCEKKLKHTLKHIQNKTPKVITIISEMDYKSKAIYADSLVVISIRIVSGKKS
jgi:hypothetical protein